MDGNKIEYDVGGFKRSLKMPSRVAKRLKTQHKMLTRLWSDWASQTCLAEAPNSETT